MSGTEMTEIYNDLISQSDGPVTKFVVVSRAIEIALTQEYDAVTISNALMDAMDYIDDNGSLPTNEF